MVLKGENVIMSKDEFRELLHDRVTLNVMKMMGLESYTVYINAQQEASELTQVFMDKHLLVCEENDSHETVEIAELKSECDILQSSIKHLCVMWVTRIKKCPMHYSISLDLDDCGKTNCSDEEVAECWKEKVIQYYRIERSKPNDLWTLR